MLVLFSFPLTGISADADPAHSETTQGSPPVAPDTNGEHGGADDEDENTAEPEPYDEDADDTADVDTETTIDVIDDEPGLSVFGDLRPIIDNLELQRRDGTTDEEWVFGGRARIGVIWAVSGSVQLGARVAGTCFSDGECDLDWELKRAGPLGPGEFTLDQLFLHWFTRDRFNVAIGRIQTRFVLRGGVFARSLDRNDSNNVNVTWTDGLQLTFRERHGWASSFVLQRNSEDGSGSIRRGLLDFADDGARNTLFYGVENTRRWGPVVQRAFDVSYLPSSLLKDGSLDGRREDYWALVGRLALRWPLGESGARLRVGTEIGYAPETPTNMAGNLPGSGDVDGLAWDVVASVMDFKPGHNIGINYAQTGAGWFLSPQFRPNEEMFEIRYQWRSSRIPLVEARIRWREDLKQFEDTDRKRNVIDLFVRLTWRFNVRGG